MSTFRVTLLFTIIYIHIQRYFHYISKRVMTKLLASRNHTYKENFPQCVTNIFHIYSSCLERFVSVLYSSEFMQVTFLQCVPVERHLFCCDELWRNQYHIWGGLPFSEALQLICICV